MFHLASVLLTVAVVLACPLHCIANVGGTAVSPDQKLDCSCSSHESPGDTPSPEHNEHAPGEGCGCASCLCEGAVIDSETTSDGIALAESCLFTMMAATETAYLDLAVQSRLGEPSDFAASPPGGRAARILHQSFLL